MVLTDDQILNHIQHPNPNIEGFQKSHKVLDLYYNGGDVSSELEKVKNYENDAQKELRNKIARSTKDLLSNLLNPTGKVFSASGFNSVIEINSKEAQNKFNDLLEELPEGISMVKWMETYWKEAYVTDPNGLCFVEKDKEGIVYPTYKSILSIHDYSFKWNKPEYVIFLHEVQKDKDGEKKIYRVFDDEKDALYYVKGEKLHQIEGETITHNYGFVPAVLCSDIVDKKTKGKLSFINKIDEVLKEYMRDSSVHSIYKFLHGFPIFWKYSQKCVTCKGTGKITDKASTTTPKASVNCPTCSGTGQKLTNDVSDGISIAPPKEGASPLTPHIAGYVQPDLNTWAKQIEEMQDMKKDMHFALWGTYTEDDEKSETATGRYIDAQPVQDTLKTISETAQNIDERLVNYMGKIMFGDLFKSATRKYGRRFLVETPDVLWEKYLKAKEAQAPTSTLDYLYKQFLMGEYHNDAAMMEQKLKEFYIEPFPHYSLTDLKGIASPKQLQTKLLYSDFAAEADFTKDTKTLNNEFQQFINKHYEETTPQQGNG